MMRGIQFLVDDEGNKTAVLIDLKTHARLREDLYDLAPAHSRKEESRESLEAVKKRLQRSRRTNRG